MVTHGDIIGREEPGEAAGAVVDGEVSAVLAVRLRLAAVVLVMEHCTQNTRVTDIRSAKLNLPLTAEGPYRITSYQLMWFKSKRRRF